MEKTAHHLEIKAFQKLPSLGQQKRILKLLWFWPFNRFMVKELHTRLPYKNKLPVLDHTHKVCLFYSPKAGSNTALRWFLDYAEMLDKALNHGSWLQGYISNHYADEESVYKYFSNVFWSEKWLKIKLVRNPYHRFVSSFHHAVSHQKKYFPNGIPDQFSMVDFIELLEGSDKSILDAHFAPQKSGWEEIKTNLIHEILHLETLSKDIEDLKLKHNRFKDAHYNPKDSDRRNFIKRADISLNPNLHLMSYLDLEGNYPENYDDFFKDVNFKQRVYNFYKEDFEAYGYGF